MARLPRLALQGIPYHVTQRGNRRQPVFFSDGDRALYLSLLQEQATRYGLGKKEKTGSGLAITHPPVATQRMTQQIS